MDKQLIGKKVEQVIDYVKRLREKADLLEKSGFATCGLAQDYRGCARIIEKLSEQPQADKWIPCSERLPKIGQCVLIQLDMNEYDSEYDSTIQVRRYDGEQDVYKWKWEGLDIWTSEDVVLAWQPLPQPYKKEGAE